MSTPKENIGSLLVYIGWIIALWALASFFGAMAVDFVPGTKLFWINSLFWSMTSSLIAAPAYFVMFILPDVSRKRRTPKAKKQEEVEEFDPDAFEIPHEVESSEEPSVGDGVWDRELA